MQDLGKALDVWCSENGTAREDVVHVQLYGRQPPITRMNASDVEGLVRCEKLSLSSNAIEKMVMGRSLRSLKVLSMGRNGIKRIDGSIGEVKWTLKRFANGNKYQQLSLPARITRRPEASAR